MNNIHHPVQISNHDATIFAAAGIYFDFGMYCSLKPDYQSPSSDEGVSIDMFATGHPQTQLGWGIAFETTNSMTENLVWSKWLGYSEAFAHWYLAVPVNAEASTMSMLEQYNISNCSLVTWERIENETFCFWGLPGLPSGPHKKRSMHKRLTKSYQW